MPVLRTEIATTEASRLVKRLCTHWAHKFPVEFGADHGLVPFDAGTTARLQATGTALRVEVEAGDDPTLQRYRQVVENHLQRMSRTGPLAMDWRPADAGA